MESGLFAFEGPFFAPEGGVVLVVGGVEVGLGLLARGALTLGFVDQVLDMCSKLFLTGAMGVYVLGDRFVE